MSKAPWKNSAIFKQGSGLSNEERKNSTRLIRELAESMGDFSHRNAYGKIPKKELAKSK